jgi:hypothetical protein
MQIYLMGCVRINDMHYLVGHVTLFTGAGIANWNASQVKDMHFMFSGAKNFCANLSTWTFPRYHRCTKYLLMLSHSLELVL